MSSRDKSGKQFTLGRDDRMMTWSSNLNIYRVNRFHPLDLTTSKEGGSADVTGGERQRQQRGFDIVEQLLLRNMVETVENIFFYVGLECSARDCLLVCRLWRDFLCGHLFKRWAERLVAADESLRELAASERWTPLLSPDYCLEEEDSSNNSNLVYRRICSRIFELGEVWRFREPKLRRLNCDSFVLSIRLCGDSLYCGLNNGSLQLWDLDWSAKRREQEVHDKGVKCLDLNDRLIVTGSYDCTAKVWSREPTWTLLHTITLHTDSVWDLRVRDDLLVTAGLDGTVGMFQLLRDGSVNVRFLMQAHQDLVAAVDFDDDVMVTGYEDSRITIWDWGQQQQQPILMHTLLGHAGGVTGLQLNGSAVASSSYDGTVRLWSVSTGSCLRVFTEPGHFVRCVSFRGRILASGDFGGHVHVWDVLLSDDSSRLLEVRSHRNFHAHKGHVVCMQIDARRAVSGSRDRTALVQDFWAKMLDGERSRKNKKGDKGDPSRDRYVGRPSRFLRN